MAKGDVALVAGIAGFLLGGIAVFIAVGASRDARDALGSSTRKDDFDKDTIGGMGDKLTELEESQKALGKRIDRLSSDPKHVWDSIQQLQAKVEALEKRSGAPGDGQTPTRMVDPSPTPPRTWTRDDIDKLKTALFKGTATDAEKAQLKDALASLEGKVKDTPRDIDARLALAELYIAKLMTVPDGPERGAWSMKAVGQWTAVLDIDPDSWDAHASLGSNYSFWPEQFNKRPEAIKEFEAARKIQERSTPDPKHADTYLQLRLLYLKDGKADDAKAVLEEGLRRFPDDEELKKAKDGAK